MRFRHSTSLLFATFLIAGCKASNPTVPTAGFEPRTNVASSAETDPAGEMAGGADAQEATSPARVPEAVVARIGTESIYVSELLSTWMLVDSQGLRDILGNLVDRRLVVSESERLGVTVSPELLAQEYSGALEQMERELHKDKPAMALDEWIASSLGLDPARFRAGLRDDVKRRLLSERVVRHFIMGQDNAEVAVIVLATEEDAKAALAKVQGGEPFGRVAGEMSIDPTGEYGGRIPPVVRNESSLSRLAFGTPVGQVGGPMEEAGRWLLLQPVKVNKAIVGTWETIGPDIEASLQSRAITEPEYWLWKNEMNDLRPVDFEPFFKLIEEQEEGSS